MTDKNAVKIFEEKQVRTVWNGEQEKWYFSIIDVIAALTGNERPRKYWNDLKTKLLREGSELSDKIGQLKFRLTDVADTEQLFRLIQSIPSPKAERAAWSDHRCEEFVQGVRSGQQERCYVAACELTESSSIQNE
jgi:hypothetical protein